MPLLHADLGVLPERHRSIGEQPDLEGIWTKYLKVFNDAEWLEALSSAC